MAQVVAVVDEVGAAVVVIEMIDLGQLHSTVVVGVVEQCTTKSLNATHIPHYRHISSNEKVMHRGFNTEVSDRSSRESSRHEHRHHSRRDQSRDVKSHRSRRDHRENHPRSGRSATPSPVRRDHTAASGGRKSNGSSPRQSFSRRSDVDGSQVEEVSAMDKKQRSNNDDKPEAPKKEAKSGGVRLVRDELFAGMDDLTVDYEEDDD
ncbi:hypothetical protein PHYBOEH_007831 [Phytophthora boehmeriae]|uniref:Uncharacterized protein n=1 Tax=Phytophthora boehmeriae TaxID=109152 RepID=A0A8T1X0P0_9STRA|nr:hypothetical protein PHYBOEH_007831 [Phytophthora boehmeriae]